MMISHGVFKFQAPGTSRSVGPGPLHLLVFPSQSQAAFRVRRRVAAALIARLCRRRAESLAAALSGSPANLGAGYPSHNALALRPGPGRARHQQRIRGGSAMSQVASEQLAGIRVRTLRAGLVIVSVMTRSESESGPPATTRRPMPRSRFG
jgi:hypothetical protein